MNKINTSTVDDLLIVNAYRECIANGRNSELEKIISNSHFYSYRYSCKVGKFELGELAISKDAGTSYYYSSNVLCSRFELGEPVISKDSYFSFSYAFQVLNNRFKLGENNLEYIYLYHYVKYVLKFNHV